MNKTRFIKAYDALVNDIKDIINERIKNGTSFFRHEKYAGISNITKDFITVDVNEGLGMDVWFEKITWKEIRKKRLNNFLKKLKIWQKISR